MDDVTRFGRETGGQSSRTPTFVGTRGRPPQQLADVLERVLDKGIVIVGDIQVRLLDIELLTIKLRLLVASVDRAREMGINWWEGDAFVSSLEERDMEESGQSRKLQHRVEALEQRLTDGAQLPNQAEGSRHRDRQA
jgi:hypothetical protein